MDQNLQVKKDFKSTKDLELYDSILKFISKKSRFLFSKDFCTESSSVNELTLDTDDDNGVYPDPPLIEHFMNVPVNETRRHLLEYIEIGDVVIANVNTVVERGLYAQMICFDNEKRRDVEHLKLNLFCSSHDLQQYLGARNSNIIQQNDLMRCFVKSIDKAKEICDIHFEVPDNGLNSVKKIGLVTTSDLPYHYTNLQHYRRRSYTYNEIVKHEKSYHNTASLKILTNKIRLNKSPKISMMSGIFNYEAKESETAIQLRKIQTRNLALQSVAKGIKLFKENNSADAMLHYNKALSIDEENVDGLVARGALYANNGDWSKAIQDFEKALTFDPNHINAKKYLFEVIMDRAVKLEKVDAYDEALGFYQKLLDFNDLIQNKMDLIKAKINEIEEKKDKANKKNYYGPQLPSKNGVEPNGKSDKSGIKKKKKKKHRHSSSSSSRLSSSSSSQSVKIIHSSSKDKSHCRRSEQLSKTVNLKRSRSRSRDNSRFRNDRNHSLTHKYDNRKYSNDRLSKSFTASSTSNEKRMKKNEHEEDLEEFYLKLKQKAAAAKK